MWYLLLLLIHHAQSSCVVSPFSTGNVVVEVTEDTDYCDLRSTDGVLQQVTLRILNGITVTISGDIDTTTITSLMVESGDASGGTLQLASPFPFFSDPPKSDSFVMILVDVVFTNNLDQSISAEGSVTFGGNVMKQNGSLIIAPCGSVTFRDSVDIAGSLTITGITSDVSTGISAFQSDVNIDGDLIISGPLSFDNVVEISLIVTGNIDLYGGVSQVSSNKVNIQSTAVCLCGTQNIVVAGTLSIKAVDITIHSALIQSNSDIHLEGKVEFTETQSQSLYANSVTVIGALTKLGGSSDVLTFSKPDGSNKLGSVTIPDGTLELHGPCEVGDLTVKYLNVRRNTATINATGNVLLRNTDGISPNSIIESDMIFSAESAVLTVSGDTTFMGNVLFAGDLTVTKHSTYQPTVKFQSKIEGGMSLTLTSIQASLTAPSGADIDILDALLLNGDSMLTFQGTSSTISAKSVRLDGTADLKFTGIGSIAPGERIISNSTSFVQRSGGIEGQSISIEYGLIDLASSANVPNIKSTDGNGYIRLWGDRILLANQGINSVGDVDIKCYSECDFDASIVATRQLKIFAESTINSASVAHQGDDILLESSETIIIGDLTATSGGVAIQSSSLNIMGSLTSASTVNIISTGLTKFGSFTINGGGLTIDSALLEVGMSSTINGNVDIQSETVTVAGLENNGGDLVINCDELQFTGPVKLTGGSADVAGRVLTFSGSNNIFESGLSITTTSSGSLVTMASFTASSAVSIIGDVTILFSGAVTVNSGSKMTINATHFDSLEPLTINNGELDMTVKETIRFGNAVSVDNAIFSSNILESTSTIDGTSKLTIVATTVELFSIASDGFIEISASSFTATGNIGRTTGAGITLPDCTTELTGHIGQTIDAGSGTLTAPNKILKMTAFDLKINGVTVELNDMLTTGGGNLEIEATTLTAKKKITSGGMCSIKNFQTSYIMSEVECVGLELSGTTVELSGVRLSAGTGTFTANGLILGTQAVTLEGSSFTLGNFESNALFELIFQTVGQREIELGGHIHAENIDLGMGTLILTGSVNHELKSETIITLEGARKKEPNLSGDLTFEGNVIYINGPVEIQNGMFTTTISGPHAELSLLELATKISASNGININWPLTALASPLEIRANIGSTIEIVLNDISCSNCVLNVYGNVNFGGQLNIGALNVYGDGGGVVVKAFGNIAATDVGISIFQGDLELLGDGTQHLDASTAIQISGGEVKKPNGDLFLTVTGISGPGVQIGGKLTLGGNLEVEGKASFQGDVDISGDAIFSKSLLVNQIQKAIIKVGGELRINDQIETSPDVNMLEFIAVKVTTLGSLTGSSTNITMRSPWEIHGNNINVQNLICYESVAFESSQKCSVNVKHINFKGPVQGGDAEVEIVSDRVSFEMDVDMKNSPLSLIQGVLTAKGNITSQRTITCQKDVNLVGCGTQSVSQMELSEGNVIKKYGGLLLTGQLTMHIGSLKVSGSLNANGLSLMAGDIIVGGNAILDGLVTMGSALKQFVRVGGELTVTNLNKDAVSVFLSGNGITLGTTKPAIRAGGGGVFYCGTLNCAPCGDCNSCIEEKEGSAQGGQEIPKIENSCLGDFPDSLIIEGGCNPTVSPTKTPTLAPTNSPSPPPTNSPTKAPILSSISSSTCQPGELNCDCIEDERCNPGLTCDKFICKSTSPSQGPVFDFETLSPTQISGVDFGAQLSMFWSIFTIAFVFII